jgi:TMEM175 potassium channel family protein
VSTNRLEAFSDGVFAIAATLLILDIHVVPSKHGLAHDLATEWPHYATFAVSFITIGIIWVNHHTQFTVIAQVDRPLLFINLALLMVVAFIPFPTGLLATYLRSPSDQHVAAALYAGTFLVLGLTFFATWRYAATKQQLLGSVLSEADVRRLVRRNLAGLGPYAAAVAIAFVSAPVSLAVCAAVAVYYMLPGRLPEPDMPGTASGKSEQSGI